jgi:hypothetical protein
MLFVIPIALVSGEAKADWEIPGMQGIPDPSEAGCWLKSAYPTAFGVAFNSCGASDWEFRQIDYPLTFQTTWDTTWHAEVRGTQWIECSLFAFPEDASVPPSNSDWIWGAGLSTPLRLDLPTNGYSVAFVHCFVPHGGYIASVKWWMSP